jgi:hypothetical protein
MHPTSTLSPELFLCSQFFLLPPFFSLSPPPLCSLWNNSIDTEGAKALADALRVNTSLTTLGYVESGEVIGHSCIANSCINRMTKMAATQIGVELKRSSQLIFPRFSSFWCAWGRRRGENLLCALDGGWQELSNDV